MDIAGLGNGSSIAYAGDLNQNLFNAGNKKDGDLLRLREDLASKQKQISDLAKDARMSPEKKIERLQSLQEDMDEIRKGYNAKRISDLPELLRKKAEQFAEGMRKYFPRSASEDTSKALVEQEEARRAKAADNRQYREDKRLQQENDRLGQEDKDPRVTEYIFDRPEASRWKPEADEANSSAKSPADEIREKIRLENQERLRLDEEKKKEEEKRTEQAREVEAASQEKDGARDRTMEDRAETKEVEAARQRENQARLLEDMPRITGYIFGT